VLKRKRPAHLKHSNILHSIQSLGSVWQRLTLNRNTHTHTHTHFSRHDRRRAEAEKCFSSLRPTTYPCSVDDVCAIRAAGRRQSKGKNKNSRGKRLSCIYISIGAFVCRILTTRAFSHPSPSNGVEKTVKPLLASKRLTRVFPSHFTLTTCVRQLKSELNAHLLFDSLIFHCKILSA